MVIRKTQVFLPPDIGITSDALDAVKPKSVWLGLVGIDKPMPETLGHNAGWKQRDTDSSQVTT